MTAQPSTHGLYFEDIEVGAEYESPGRTVTETDIVLFAGLSGDYNVLHTDAEHMKSSQFGERIAHGLLVLSIQEGLLGRVMPDGAGLAHASIAWRFRGPIKIGDTIRVRARITAKEESAPPGRGIIRVERHVMNQRDEVVQEGETEHVIERRHG